MLSAALLERWPQVCDVKITFTQLPTNRSVCTTNISMKCVVNWIPLRIRVRSRNTQPYLKCILQAVLIAPFFVWWVSSSQRIYYTSPILERFSTFERKPFSNQNPCHHCSEFLIGIKQCVPCDVILFYHSQRCGKLIKRGPRASSWV